MLLPKKRVYTSTSNMRDDDRKEMEHIHSGVVNSMNDGKVFTEKKNVEVKICEY